MKEIHPPKPKSVLSIDVGRKRIGLAGCDPLGLTITSLPALLRKDFENDLKRIESLCQTRHVQGLVVGLPLDDSGGVTKQTKHCEKYGLRIAIALKLPIAWVNEHSSTWAAGEQNGLQNDRSGKLDSAAAALLLKQWLQEGPELEPLSVPTTQ